MVTFFVDSSAFVKRYRSEGGSQRVAYLLAGGNRPLIARLAAVEVSSALVRRGRTIGLSADALNVAFARLDGDLRDSVDIIELDHLVMELAVTVTRKHGLRGADAVQLACLMLAQSQNPDLQLVLLSADDELNAAAIAEGFSVENPNLHA